MIAIIDYGAGNLRSVTNSIAKLGYKPTLVKKPEELLKADVIFFPGVGAAAEAIQSLKASGMDVAIRKVIKERRPFFAVCIGMQLLMSSTEEGGQHKCLGIIPGTVQRIPAGPKIPHMGWNQVKQIVRHPVFKGIPDESNFYFVHSYYVKPGDNAVVAGTTEYGITLCSVIIKDNLIATQFHPEKSGSIGLKMYDNFLKAAQVKE